MESTAFFTTPLSAITQKWRIFYEESADLNPRSERDDFQELHGARSARIYRHGEGIVAVSTENARLYKKLEVLPGLQKKNGCVLLFPDALLDTVAEAIRAKKQRQYTPEQREAVKDRLARWQFASKGRSNEGV